MLMRLRAFAVVLIALLCVSGCTVNFRNANAFYGKDVEQKIGETIVPMLHNYDPTLKIDKPKCEDLIVWQQGTMSTCTLTVSGVPLDIRVAGDGPNAYKVDFDGAYFYDMPKIETVVENNLQQNYGLRSVVHCGQPRARLLQTGVFISCGVVGSSKVTSVRLKTSDAGQVFIFNVPGLKSSSAISNVPLSAHKQERPAIARGADVERFIAETAADVPGQPHYSVNCPHVMDLTGASHGICAIAIPGTDKVQRIGVWIDDAVGLVARPIDAVIDRGRVQKMAQEDLNRRLADNDDAADAVVKCQPGLTVIQPPGTFDCQATAGGKRYRLIVSVEDYKGTVSWRGVELK